MGTKLIFWDFDGTLGFRAGGWSAALQEVLLEQLPAASRPVEDFRPFLNSGFPWHQPQVGHVHLSDPEQYWRALEGLFARAYSQLGYAKQANALAKQVRYHYINSSAWALYPDTLPTLEMLSAQGWLHVLITNHVPELPAIAHSLGLEVFLLDIVNSAEVGYEKPHARIFEFAKARAGQPSTVWMVGDNVVADVLGAEAAGIPAILVRREDPRATRQCHDLTGVAAIISGSVGRGEHHQAWRD